MTNVKIHLLTAAMTPELHRLLQDEVVDFMFWSDEEMLINLRWYVRQDAFDNNRDIVEHADETG